MGKPKAESVQDPSAAAPLDVRKQAVVVIHGMGEPVPMDTMRSFVDAVWETDPSFDTLAGDLQGTRASQKHNDSWLVPDQRTGSLELFRITTPPFVPKGSAKPQTAARTDFYEFYWSDIMEGTTFQHVRAWMAGLLFRWPYQVPRRVMAAWILLWVSVIVATWLAVAGLLGLDPRGQHSFLWQTLFDPWWNPELAGRGLTLFAAAILLWAFVARLRGSRMPGEQSVRPFLSWLLALAVPAAIAAAGWFLVPWPQVLVPPVLLLLLSALLGYFIQVFLVPYFGDVARYVRAAPDTIAKRAEVRERGLKLLRELHRVRPSKEGEPADEGYQRIVVVAHSLGSIIAYDILNHFWAEMGPTGSHNPPEGEVPKALKDVDDYIAAHTVFRPGTAPGSRAGSTRKVSRSIIGASFDAPDFRGHQRNLSRALVRQPGGKGWRISDFITLGSPLSHAEFLLARDRTGLEQRIAERQIATCPPYPDPASGSILYRGKDKDGKAKDYAHHASVFAATRWTNIHDPHVLTFFGDIISGPVGGRTDGGSSVADDLFGRGIRDVGVRMRRRWFAFSRLFTHTFYWSLDVTGERVNGDGTRPEPEAATDERLDHVTELRKAVNLAEIFD
ncbi:hypothetical protein GRZ55_08045 [Chelativorans sp. ZYF759]|uniref:hypothetical protein n=1 Tax=Chelativorans sp. ZYF759 TaxID=2692213 RepID=UPI00145ED49C|nr:hypothetical protein [Chelativorans sp. ZYF759]NMG39189.1 hypothetical protein [Chelativorans sp. ZYF759]